MIREIQGLAASPKLLELAAGLYSLTFAEVKTQSSELAGFRLPATHLAVPADAGGAAKIELFPGTGASSWVGPEGGTVVINVPGPVGRIVITTYSAAGSDAAPLSIQMALLNRPVQLAAPSDRAQPKAALQAPVTVATTEPLTDTMPSFKGKPIKVEVILQVHNANPERFESGQWAGEKGKKRRLQAFSLRPLEIISPDDIEYKAYGPNMRETQWVKGGQLCGGRGGGTALTGFAVRLVPALQKRFEVLYQGSFFRGGVAGPKRDGEVCASSQMDDPLEAINLVLVEKASD